MKRRLLLLILLIGAVGTAHAQNKLPTGRWNVRVRQSFESTDTKAEPAVVFLTFPDQTSASYAVDGGVAIEREAPDNRFYGKLIGEYHRNTLIDKKQNNGQFGVGFERYLRRMDSTRNYILNGTAKYVRDVVAAKGSLLHTLELSPFSPTFNTPLRAGGTDANYVLISPSVGYEYQNTFDAKTEKRDSLRGNVLRGTGKVKVSLTLNKRIKVAGPERTKTTLYERTLSGNYSLTKKQLFETNPDQSIVIPAVIISVNGAMRYDIVNTTRTPNGWHPYLQASVDYVLTRDKKLVPQLSLGFNFTTGENPAQGLAKQKYWLLALKFAL